ncbi:hypothetical protein N9M10_05310 [Hellea sp.]|nr:hypothetical protein [Hellea sp.]
MKYLLQSGAVLLGLSLSVAAPANANNCGGCNPSVVEPHFVTETYMRPVTTLENITVLQEHVETQAVTVNVPEVVTETHTVMKEVTTAEDVTVMKPVTTMKPETTMVNVTQQRTVTKQRPITKTRSNYRAHIRPHLMEWLDDEIALRDAGATLNLLDRLDDLGEDQGVLLYARARVLDRALSNKKLKEDKVTKALVADQSMFAVVELLQQSLTLSFSTVTR